MYDATRLVTLDYYATLGVSRAAEDVVIRAAYLALMRRYHPDANSSPEAAERVRGVTTAYEVLSDRTNAPIMTADPTSTDPQARDSSGPSVPRSDRSSSPRR